MSSANETLRIPTTIQMKRGPFGAASAPQRKTARSIAEVRSSARLISGALEALPMSSANQTDEIRTEMQVKLWPLGTVPWSLPPKPPGTLSRLTVGPADIGCPGGREREHNR